MQIKELKSKTKELENKIKYAVNDLLARNPLWQILVLVIISVIIIGLADLLIEPSDIVSDSGKSTGGQFWWLFTRLLDQGTFIGDYEYSTFVAVVGVMVTLGGILVLSLLIGIFSSKITEQIDSLKRGKSPIVQKNHLVVCGSGDRMYEVVRELVEAVEENSLSGKIVLFSSASREEMEEILSQRLKKNQRKKVICRSGVTTDYDALDLPRFDRCRGFVVVGDNDANIIKTLIAVEALREKNVPNGICEIRVKAKERIAKMAYKEIHCVPVREIVMRLLVQIGRQPGLSSVYNEVLSFNKSEFYLIKNPKIVGASFVEISRMINEGIAVGIESEENVILNPPSDMLFSSGDSLLVLAKNELVCSFSSETKCLVTSQKREAIIEKPLKILVFSGLSNSFGFMLDLLERYSEKGAEVTVAGSLPEVVGLRLLSEMEFTNCRVSYINRDRTDPDMVKALHLENFDTIMVISGKGAVMSDEEVDSECIVTLLIIKHLREEFIEDRGFEAWNTTVVSEIRNPRNRKLASAAGIDDFVVSNEVCSMVMAQLVIQPGLSKVYAEIFDPSGCEIQLRNALNYEPGKFCEIVEQGFARNEIVLGWLTGTRSNVEVLLNPKKDAIVPVGVDTKMVVIAER